MRKGPEDRLAGRFRQVVEGRGGFGGVPFGLAPGVLEGLGLVQEVSDLVAIFGLGLGQEIRRSDSKRLLGVRGLEQADQG